MNDTTPDPLAPDPLDERLSAALDGEGGTDAPGPEHDARRRALADARDVLAIAPPPLDDLTRRRLLRNALDASGARALDPVRPDRAWMRRVLAAAVLVPIVLLLGFGIAHLGGGSGSQKSSGAAGTSLPEKSAGSGLANLAEIGDARVLRTRVLAALRSPPTAQPNASQTSGALSYYAPSPDSAAARCLPSVKPPKGVTAHAFGDATYHGAAATVYVALQDSRALVYVLANRDCHLLTAQFIGTR